MIEVVFSQSACGSLKVAQSYGVGQYHGGDAVVFLHTEEGFCPTEEEIRVAQMQAEEKARRDWENAIPVGSSRNDIYCLGLALSMGEITETKIGAQRRAALEKIYSVWPKEHMEEQLDEVLQSVQEDLASVLERCAAGEEIRVWYSHNPDEMCGMYWLMAQLRTLKHGGTVHLVKLPEWDCQDDTTMRMYQGWGEIGPGEWGKYLSFQQEGKPVFIETCAMRWRELQQENAPLRICLNGKLQSAPEHIYDSYILRELDAQGDEFSEAKAIGNVLGKYQLGIGDAWIALRIEQFIKEGMFEVITSPPSNGLIYRRMLRKRR